MGTGACRKKDRSWDRSASASARAVGELIMDEWDKDDWTAVDEASHRAEQLADLDTMLEELRAGGVAYLSWYRQIVKLRREFRKSYGLPDDR